MQTVTIWCPNTLTDAGNHVHVLLGKSDTLQTYSGGWIAPNGDTGSVSSGLWSDAQISGVGNHTILDAPHLQELYVGNGGIVDRSLCEQAQAAFSVIDLENPQFDPSKIVAVIGPSGAEALAMLGVTRNTA